ncbi:hypothetical protein ACQEU8_17675 [Streptomyces sp. CA-250714]
MHTADATRTVPHACPGPLPAAPARVARRLRAGGRYSSAGELVKPRR